MRPCAVARASRTITLLSAGGRRHGSRSSRNELRQGGGTATPVTVDVTEEDEVINVFHAVDGTPGELDFVSHSAGNSLEEIGSAAAVESSSRPTGVARPRTVAREGKPLPSVASVAPARPRVSEVMIFIRRTSILLRTARMCSTPASLPDCASFLESPARRGYLALVLCSDPGDALIAPFGGASPVLIPNPIAAGAPCGGDPILIDLSMSITTAGLTVRARGERLPGPWLVDAYGGAGGVRSAPPPDRRSRRTGEGPGAGGLRRRGRGSR